MRLNLIIVAEVGAGIALWLGFIISMAISNGLLREMRMDNAGGELRWTWPPPGIIAVTRKYSTRHPGTKKPRQMWLASAAGFLCFITVIALVLSAAW